MRSSFNIVCLFGVIYRFNIRGHMMVPACSSGTSTCATTLECHAADTGHDIPTRHSKQTQDQPIIVLSIDVEHHTGIHNYPF